MIHHPGQVLTWLRLMAARRDRVLAAALDSGRVLSVEQDPPNWRVHLQSRRGIAHNIVVVPHPVTGEPMRYYKEPTNDRTRID